MKPDAIQAFAIYCRRMNFRHILNMNTKEQTPAAYNGCERAAVAIVPYGSIEDLNRVIAIIGDQTAAPAMYEALEMYQNECARAAQNQTRPMIAVLNKAMKLGAAALAAARKGGAL